MKNKCLALLLSCFALMGCTGGNSCSIEELSNLESSYYYVGVDSRAPDTRVGFVSALVGSIGTYSPTDKITFDVYYGRAQEEEGFYEEYEGCEFYFSVDLYCAYLDKRGEDKVQIDSLTIPLGNVALPDLMDDEYVFDKEYPLFKHSLKYIFDLSIYYQKFITANGCYCDPKDDNFGKDVVADIEETDVYLFFNIMCKKNDLEKEAFSSFPAYDTKMIVKNGQVNVARYKVKENEGQM